VGISVGMVTINTGDPQRLASFWTAALGLTVELDIGDYIYLKRPSGGIVLSFQRVGDPAPTGARVHLDLSVDDPIDPADPHASRRAAVNRLVDLGAAFVEEHVLPHTAWTIMTDPDGNVFCVGQDTPAVDA
jgi:catechol 2,3-dioxygenase-like lactoylglutathione lyase family enzyme